MRGYRVKPLILVCLPRQFTNISIEFAKNLMCLRVTLFLIHTIPFERSFELSRFVGRQRYRQSPLKGNDKIFFIFIHCLYDSHTDSVLQVSDNKAFRGNCHNIDVLEISMYVCLCVITTVKKRKLKTKCYIYVK